MMQLADGSHLYATFEADGSIDLDDRQHLLDCYAGIAFQTIIVVVPDAPGMTATLPTNRFESTLRKCRFETTLPTNRFEATVPTE